MVAKRDKWMIVEDFLALDRENLDQKLETIGLALLVDDIYEKVILPPSDPFRKYRKRNKRED